MSTLGVLSDGRPFPAVQWHGWVPSRLPPLASALKGIGLWPMLSP